MFIEWWCMKDKLLPWQTYRNYHPGDVSGMDLLDVFDNDIGAKERAEDMALSAFAITYTILCPDGTPMAIVGGFYKYTKVMEVWSLVDKKMLKMPKYYCHALKFLINQSFEDLKLERMQVIMQKDAPWVSAWSKFLGFEAEGILRKYGEENVDYIMFSKVR